MEKLREKFSHNEISLAEAVRASARCVCPGPEKGGKAEPCRPACPAGVDVWGFIERLQALGADAASRFGESGEGAAEDALRRAENDPSGCDPAWIEMVDRRIYEAHGILWSAHPAYLITAAVCPAELLCEKSCVTVGTASGPVSIQRLESFVAGWMTRNWERIHAREWAGREIDGRNESGPRVAVIGTGPAGLSAALELLARGAEAELFEMEERPGGLFCSAIPEFRSPAVRTLKLAERLREWGAEFHFRAAPDDSGAYGGFDGTILAVGRRSPVYPGERTNYSNVSLETDFLSWAADFAAGREAPGLEAIARAVEGRTAVVRGGGNSALDAARVLVRLGAREVFVLSSSVERKRKATEVRSVMLNRELQAARAEGVSVLFGVRGFRTKGSDRVESVCFRAGNEAERELHPAWLVYAVGRSLGKTPFPNLLLDDYGRLAVSGKQEAMPGVYAAGDCCARFDAEETNHLTSNVLAAALSGRGAARALLARLGFALP